MIATFQASIIALRGWGASMWRNQDYESVHARPTAAFLVLLPGAARARLVMPDLGRGGNPVFSILLSMRFPPPIHRPAIPLAVRQQDKVQKHVDELRSGDIPILSQASPDL